MRALVEQYTAALPGPGGAPCPGIIVKLCAVPVRDQPAHPFQLSQLPAVDHFLQLPVYAVGPLIKHHAEGQLRVSVRFGDHFPHLQGINARRLFHHCVQPVPEGGNGQPRMLIMRYGNQHRVTLAGSNQFLSLGEYCRARNMLLRPCSARCAPVCRRCQHNLGAESGKNILCVACPHIADPDDPQTYFVHLRLLLTGHSPVVVSFCACLSFPSLSRSARSVFRFWTFVFRIAMETAFRVPISTRQRFARVTPV